VLLMAVATPITEPRARAAALAGLAPGDFLSQAEYAFALAKDNELPAALAHYRAAIAANPDYARARANYGAALERVGELDEARAQYLRVLELPDHLETHRQAHVNVGVLELLRGDRAAADRHFAAGAQLGGEHPIGRMLALAKALPPARAEHRHKLWSGVLALDPDQPDARFALGEVMLAQRRFDVAAHHFTVFSRRVPDHPPALLGLATAQAELGQLAEARAALQRLLQREPRHAAALALQASFEGR
jgi:Tfp pilus assembly protein PilF